MELPFSQWHRRYLGTLFSMIILVTKISVSFHFIQWSYALILDSWHLYFQTGNGSDDHKNGSGSDFQNNSLIAESNRRSQEHSSSKSKLDQVKKVNHFRHTSYEAVLFFISRWRSQLWSSGNKWSLASRGCGFESQHRILDKHFSHYIVAKNEKEAGNGPFLQISQP